MPHRPRPQHRALSDDRVCDLVLDAYTRVRHDGAFASELLAEAFRRRADLGPRARATANRRLFGMIHFARKLEYALEAAGAQLTRETQIFAQYLALRVLQEDLTLAAAHAALPVVNWKAVAAIDEQLAREGDPVRRLALSCSLPDALAERFVAEFGGDATALALSLSAPAPLTLRANTLKLTRTQLAKELSAAGIATQPTKFARHGLTLERDTEAQDQNAEALRHFRGEGLFEPQDEGSQLIAELAANARHSRTALTVDFCAGAGGKTVALGAAMKNQGQLYALSLRAHDHAELKHRVRRAGLDNVHPLQLRGTELPAELAALRGKAECILVDAPCSGVGALRRKPEARWRIDAETLTRLPAEQAAILNHAAQLCAPGGRIVYATCTVLRAENEALVEAFVATHPKFTLGSARGMLGQTLPAPLAAVITDPSGTFLKLFPHIHGTDGFFAAVIQKTHDVESKS